MNLSPQESGNTPAPPDTTRIARPSEYRDSRRGLEMSLSGGFVFGANREGITILGSETAPGAVFIKAGERFSFAELERASQFGYQDEGVQLTSLPTASALTITGGVGMVVPVQGILDTTRVRGLLAGVIAQTGECFILLAATTPEQWGRMEPHVRKMFASIRLFSPELPPVDLEWRAYFAGARLSYHFSRTSTSLGGTIEGGASSTVQLDLCGDGTFIYGDRSRMAFDLPQAFGYRHAQTGSSGRWHVESVGDGIAALTLEFFDGRLWRYQAHGDREVTFLNGSRYARSISQVCK